MLSKVFFGHRNKKETMPDNRNGSPAALEKRLSALPTNMPLCTLQHTGASFLYGYLSDQHASYAFCFSFRSALSAYMRSSAMRNSASGSGAGSAGSAWKPILAAT